MKLESIRLRNFRNYEDILVNFSPFINVLYGNNAQGKTNLVEAIHYASLLSSFRTSNDQSLVRKNEMFSILDYKFKDKGFTDKEIRITLNKTGKKIFVDEEEYKRFRDYIGLVNVISFCSDDIKNFKTSPKDRRKMFDEEISKINKEYLLHLLKLKKYLKQRNEILKQETKYLNEYLDTIDKKIAEDSLYIYQVRKELVERINNKISSIYKELFLKDDVIKVKYKSCFDKEEVSKEKIFEIYKENREKDKEKKQTNIGVHKDDYEIEVNDLDFMDYTSSGQQRLILLSLKLTIMRLIEEKNYEKTILILDDIFSELDKEKQKAVIKFVEDENQVFITTTDKSEITSDEKISFYKIKQGIVTERVDEND